MNMFASGSPWSRVGTHTARALTVYGSTILGVAATVDSVPVFALPRVGPKSRCSCASPNGVFRAVYLNPNIGRFWTMDRYEGKSEDPLSIQKYLYCQASPVNVIDPSGLVSYVGFNTVGWDNFGHVGIITHNPVTGIYTRFDHTHGTVRTVAHSNVHSCIQSGCGFQCCSGIC